MTLQNSTEKDLAAIGPSQSVERFLSGYGKITTKASYASHLKLYFVWLRNVKGVGLTPDELVLDNLKSVFESGATNTLTKRKHTDWLSEYVNASMVERGLSDSKRQMAAATVRMFYRANDSPLFGAFKVSQGAVVPPPKPLKAEDIRAVLSVLPVNIRAPLVCVWQSGIEIGRILSLRWKDLEGLDAGEYPLKLTLYGRKRHRRAYSTFLGRDAITHLKAIRTNGELVFPSVRNPENTSDLAWLNVCLKGAAAKLEGEELIGHYPRESWHTHALRHSFETEASHAGVRAEIRDYFMGHITGIQWTYNHRDEIHPQDLIEEYLKIEPLVSLNPTEATLKVQFASREKEIVNQLGELWTLYQELKAELLGAKSGRPFPQAIA